tara:strand:- start:698 stop:1087 length:390 start_codon:yes stop_codon:yes gene_type:complete
MSEHKKLVNLYNDFISSLDLTEPSQYKMFKLATEIDHKINNKLKTLFLISLFCNVFYHIYGTRKGQLGQKLNFNPRIKCKNYTIFTYDNDKTDILLTRLTTFFNTDAINLLPITSLILQDLNNMKVYML